MKESPRGVLEGRETGTRDSFGSQGSAEEQGRMKVEMRQISALDGNFLQGKLSENRILKGQASPVSAASLLREEGSRCAGP